MSRPAQKFQHPRIQVEARHHPLEGPRSRPSYVGVLVDQRGAHHLDVLCVASCTEHPDSHRAAHVSTVGCTPSRRASSATSASIDASRSRGGGRAMS